MKEWYDDLLGLKITSVSGGISIEEDLQQLSDKNLLGGWKFKEFSYPNSWKYCLFNGVNEVSLDTGEVNSARTSAIMPLDLEKDASKCNQVIRELETIFQNTPGIETDLIK